MEGFVQVLTITLPVITLIIGAVLGHRLAVKRDERRVVIEKRAEYTTEFMAQAYHNLRYVLNWKQLETESQGPGDFTVMGFRAAFYVSDEAASKIDGLTNAYGRASVSVADARAGRVTPEDRFTELKSKIDSLKELLRSELKVT